MPDQMKMVRHDDKSIDDNAIVVRQKSKTIGNDYFFVVVFQQMFPIQYCCCEEKCIRFSWMKMCHGALANLANDVVGDNTNNGSANSSPGLPYLHVLKFFT